MRPAAQENTYVPLDFKKIGSLFLRGENPPLACAALQALRWRITKTKGAYVRREIVVSYATYDIVGCKPTNENLQSMLLQKDDKIKE
jgi:hypothetical protein